MNPSTSDASSSKVCERCEKIPHDDLFRPSNFSNRAIPAVFYHPVNHIKSISQCPSCLFLTSIRTRLWRNEWERTLNFDKPKPWLAPADPKYLFCSFRPPRGMLWPLPAAVCTVVSLEGSNESDEANFRKWCSDADYFPWSIAEFVELCQEGRMREVIKASSIDGRMHPPLYNGKDLEELKRFVAKSTLLSKDEKTDKRLCDIAPGFRLIDCQSRRIVSPAVRGSYVTLSYVWGLPDSQQPGLGPFTLPKSVPQVIEDSISVTKMLGFRYIWVDRYCIPQDDEKAKGSQIQLMGEIYATSALTIIAAAGNGPDHGLSGISRPTTAPSPEHPSRAIQTGAYTPVAIRALSPNKVILPKTKVDIHREVQKSKWNTRGWTYQEAILSARRLVFTPSYIYFQGPSPNRYNSNGSWVFRSGLIADVFPNPPYSGLNSCGTGTRDDLFSVTHLLMDHASNYVRRDLTHDCDAYPAFKGIQSHLQSKLGANSFFYGLQLLHNFRHPNASGSRSRNGVNVPDQKSLAPALLWTFVGSLSSISRRSDVPSWTWLGWKLGHGQDVKGPVWPKDKLFEFTSEISLVGLLYKDGFAFKWHETFGVPSSSQSPGLRDDIPHLRVNGWIFPAAQLLEADAVTGKEAAGEPGASSATLTYAGGIEQQTREKDNQHALRLELPHLHSSDAESLTYLVVGRLGHSEREKFPMVFIMILQSKDGGASHERVHVARARLNMPWDSCKKETLGWTRGSLIIK